MKIQPCLPFILIVFLALSCSKNDNVFNVLDFGAVGDGKTVNTKAINNAIEKCNQRGGGTVLIPAGAFLSGTILLRSNVDLHLDAGAVLLGSKDTSDYREMTDMLFSEGYNRYGLIYAANAHHIALTGLGEINGNGTHFMNGIDKPHMGHDFDRSYTRQGTNFMNPEVAVEDGPVSYSYRPGLMVILERCENVHIENISFRNSPEWTIRVGDSDNVNIRGITIDNNPLIPNSDGIHCTNSRNVRISDCHIATGDDAIVITGFGHSPLPGEKGDTLASGNKTGYAENTTVSNCVLSSRSSCVRIGYGEHPIRNLVFSNLVMHASNRGIGIYARNNTRIENVLFENITIETRLHDGHWWGKGEPIHISSVKDDSTGNGGKISDIKFANIRAVAEAGILIYGVKESVIENLEFTAVSLTVKAGKHSDAYGGNFDLRPADHKRRAIFKHDLPGLYAQYVKNLRLSQCQLSWGSPLAPFFTNGIEINHFEGLSIVNYRGTPAFSKPGLYGIDLSDGTKAVILNADLTAVSIRKNHVY